ncbi:hypothetical protein ACTFIW_006590 [Dictyostelium discoideum]
MKEKEKQFHDSDELLITLNDFIKSNEKDLKSGNICLTLNPICIEQLNLYLNGKRISFKISKSELLDLQFIISLIKYLRIDPNEQGLLEKNRDLNLKLFDSIKFLEISYVKPGLITNLFELSQNIEQLTVSGSLNSLDELLIVEDEVRLPYYQSIGSIVFEQHEDGQPLSQQELSNKRFQYLYKKNKIWLKLKELDLSFNSIPEIDQSAYSLLSIEKLCFEGNLISKVNNLQECLFLRTLNLSFNMIKDMENINQELGMITHLSLRGNQIERVESLNRLYALECLDISKNNIKDIQEIFKLNTLPNLQYLFIDENPFCDLKDYRNIIISNFLNSDNIIHLLREFYLDGKRISEYEIEFIKKHTHDNGSFKSYKSPIKPVKPPKSKKDIVPLVVEFAPNARIDGELINNDNNNNQSIINGRTTTTTTMTTNGKRKKDTHKHHHPNFNHGVIEPVIDNLPDYDSEVTENQVQDDKFEEEKNLKKKIDDLRSEGGNSWLLVLNEMSTFKENNHPIPDYNENNNNNNNLSSPVKLQKTPIKSPMKKKNIYHNTPINNNNTNSNNNNSNETSPLKLNVISSSPPPPPTDTTSNVTTTTNVVSPTNSSTSSNTTTTTTTTSSSSTTTTTEAININNNKNKSTSTTPISTTPNSTTPISTSLLSKSLLSKSPNTNGGNIISSELICEPFSVIKNSQNLLLQIKIDTILESNLFGHSVNSYLLKDIVFVFSVPDAVDPNTAEIVFATDFKNGVPIAFSREYYQMEDQQSLHQLLTTLVPPLYREYTMNCMDCSERYVCKSEHDFTHCIKCNSKGLFYLPTTTDRSIMVVESPPSASSFSNSLSLRDMKNFIEYNDDEFNDRIFKDQSLQLYFKLKVFKGGSKEVYQYIMKSNFVRYTSATSSSSLSSLLEEEKQIFLLLSSTTCYLLKEKKSSTSMVDDTSSNRFSIQTILPLSEIRRVSVGLSSQLFRIEMDDQCYVFIKRSQECSEKFLKLLFTITKSLSLPLEPYSRAIETKQVINALLVNPNEEFLKYIMLHHKVSGRNIVPRSLILSSENIYLTIENYHQYPLLNKNIKTTSSQFTIFKNFKITDIAHIKYSRFKPNYFTIAFENEVNNKPLIEWNLITGNSIECDTMVSTISALWKEKFHLDLKILDNI